MVSSAQLKNFFQQLNTFIIHYKKLSLRIMESFQAPTLPTAWSDTDVPEIYFDSQVVEVRS
jgi:hypothetical protein